MTENGWTVAVIEDSPKRLTSALRPVKVLLRIKRLTFRTVRYRSDTQKKQGGLKHVTPHSVTEVRKVIVLARRYTRIEIKGGGYRVPVIN